MEAKTEALVAELRSSADAFRRYPIYTQDGDPVRLTVQADELTRAADLIESQAKEIADLRGDGWLPIETAPRDGTFFDAWVPDAFGGRRVTGLSMNRRGELRKHGKLTPAEMPRSPTHWRPLPPPPSIKSEGAP